MESGEESSPVNPFKISSSTQEISGTPLYADWSSSMQAYYGAGANPSFFSPPSLPFMWTGQHPLMPPYGHPIPYPALYPPGGVYAHPNMAMAPVIVQTVADSEVKAAEGQEQPSAKKSRANVRENEITASGSGNNGATQSAESGSEGSSDGRKEINKHEPSANKRGSFEKMLADAALVQNVTSSVNSKTSVDGSQNVTTPVNFKTSVAGSQNVTTPVNSKTSVAGNPVAVPATNLNMSMDLWNPSSSSGAVNMQPTTGVSPVKGPGKMNDQRVRAERELKQAERELKRQKRKMSNRESARRSRQRKQAECEELLQKVETQSIENETLRAELQRVSEEHAMLTSAMDSMKEEITRLCGPEFVSKLESSIIKGCGGEQEGARRVKLSNYLIKSLRYLSK